MKGFKTKITILVWTMIVILTSCSVKKQFTDFGSIKNDEILWDTWGIPHIYATSEEMLYYMAGRAQMKNHANLILKLYGESRGKSALYWGRNKERDINLKRFQFPGHAERIATEMPENEKKMINAFTQGINDYAAENPTQIKVSLKQVLPIKSSDIVSHFLRLFYYEFLINRELSGVKDWKPGSNAWALRTERTADNGTYLLVNPHLPWIDFWMLFECQYISERNSLYGVTLVGLPTIGIGFNKELGWTHTVNTVDNVDFFEIQKYEKSYQIGKDIVPFKIDSFEIEVQSAEKGYKQKFARKKSKIGYVLEENAQKALIIKFPNLSKIKSVFGQWKAMGEAKNSKEFEEALRLNNLPLFNSIYADRKNNISYHFGGKVPKKKGSWKQWQSKIILTTKENNWNTLYGYNELPHLRNPKSNWLQNANDPPFTSTIPQEISFLDFDAAMAPVDMSLRAQRSALLIGNKESITFEDFITLKFDTKSQLALRWRDELIALKTKTKNPTTLAALTVLENWDGSFESSSKGAILFTNFVNEIGVSNIESLFEIPWSPEKPLQTPEGLKNTVQVLDALLKAAEKQLSSLGKLDARFGDIYRMKIGKYEYPANGSFGHLGIFRTMSYMPRKNGKNYAFHGDTFVSAISFGDSVKAKAILAYGNATETISPHVGDQLEYFSQKKLRDVWFSRQNQEDHLETIESFNQVSFK